MRTLQELKDMDLPHPTREDLGLEAAKPPEASQEEYEEERDWLFGLVDSYLEQFTVFDKKDGEPSIIFGADLCIMCGKPINGFLGTFEWGIIHGEGKCSECGYPLRAVHVVKDEDGEEVLRISRLILPYHPDGLERRETESD